MNKLTSLLFFISKMQKKKISSILEKQIDVETGRKIKRIEKSV